MIGRRFIAALAALATAGAMPGLAAATTGETVTSLLSADGTLLANALSGQALRLTMRGTTVDVLANAVPAEGGCAALVSAQAPGSNRPWSRLYRWSELAWAGAAPAGATMVTFFEQEGHAPVDTVVFHPADGAAFRDTVTRLAANCRGSRAEAATVVMAAKSVAPGCYFARLPALQLHDQPGQPRAVLTMLSRETPEAELQLLFERVRSQEGDDWSAPLVSFTFAAPRLEELRIAKASFALDARPVTAGHSITAYGATRLRIAMDSLGRPVNGKGADSFYRQLASAAEARLTLLDRAGQAKAVLNFDAGPALAAARKALKAADWSCTGAAAAPPPAARWTPQH